MGKHLSTSNNWYCKKMVANSFTNNFHFYHKDENNNLLHKANIQLMLSPAANKTKTPLQADKNNDTSKCLSKRQTN